jgi:peptidoglycan biosynthesis protein MviN/MurJ (putative lipid II flippase)
MNIQHEPNMPLKKGAPGWLRRDVWEPVTLALIALGLVMLMQPFAKDLFTYSFIVLLAGVAGYTVAGKLPE